MHYYRPLTQPVPVKTYHNFKVIVPNNFFSLATAQNFFRDYCKVIKYHGNYTWYVLTRRTESEIQDAIVGASVESI